MANQNLGVPRPSFPMAGSQQRLSVSSSGRSKVQLKPGHSLMDWIKLGRSGKDLTGVGGRRMQVTMEELMKHNTEGDAWLALRGNVYNVTPYLDFHPGGIDELMRGAGKDGTALFDEIHRWVNAESMLEKCYIGKLKVESPQSKPNSVKNGQLAPQFLAPAAPPPQSPRFDWYQGKETVSLVVYTKWPAMREDLVIVDRTGREIHLTLYLKTTIYHVHIELEKEVSQDIKVNVSADSGKVEVILQKLQVDSQWATVGRYLDKHNQTVKYSEYNPAYRDCTIEKVEAVTKDTKLLTVCLPDCCNMHIPTGYHVYIQHNIAGMDIVRSYTAVLPSLDLACDDRQITQGNKFYLMIKMYKDGVLTPWIDTLTPAMLCIKGVEGMCKSIDPDHPCQTVQADLGPNFVIDEFSACQRTKEKFDTKGDKMSISSFDGNFQLSRLTDCTHLVMFAAGTGFTPMVKLINKTLVVDKISRTVKLLFFNKTESDILWNEQLSALAATNERFIYTNCLSEAGDEWTGLRGRVTKDMVSEFVPQLQGNNKLLICVCGPTPFTQAVIKYCEELGHKDSCHAFLG